MKKINIAYWAVTGIFAAFMIFSSVSNLTSSQESIDFLCGHLGYPAYIVPFLGAAKILGAIAILMPNLRRIKEWAYAGLFFDLAGALFSVIAVDGFKPEMLFMLVFFAALFASYFLWHKKLSAN